MNVSIGQGMIVKRAAELAAAGKRGAELHTAISNAIDGMQTYALVQDLSNAVRSGRVKPAVRNIANWLHLTCDHFILNRGSISMP